MANPIGRQIQKEFLRDLVALGGVAGRYRAHQNRKVAARLLPHPDSVKPVASPARVPGSFLRTRLRDFGAGQPG